MKLPKKLSRLIGIAALLSALAPVGSAAENLFDSGAGLSGSALIPVASVPESSVRAVVVNEAVRYGVIINGDKEERHRLNVEEAAVFMRARYGIEPKNIYALSTRAASVLGNRQNVKRLALEIKNKLDDNDSLVIYTTGHGSRKKIGPALILSDGPMAAKDFASLYLDNRASSYVYLGDQCYSGGFAKAMTADSNKKVIAVSSTDDANTTVCSYFIKPYIAAFSDMANDTAPKDGSISEWEAYTVAKQVSMKKHAASRKKPGASNAQFMTSGYATPALYVNN